MILTVVHVGHDGDQYSHIFADADFSTEHRPGFITVVGRPVNGYQAGKPARTEHYPTDRVIRIIEEGVVVFAKREPAEAVQS